MEVGMGQIIVRNLDDAAIAGLKTRAKKQGVSVEEFVRQLIKKATAPSREELIAEIDRIAAMGPRQKTPIAAKLIREGREER
jgi:plasmid stability protein